MNDKEIEIVQGTFAKVVPIADQAADIFYDRLFEIAPDTRALFPEDMSSQKKKLIQMLAVAVNGLKELDTIVPAVRDLGARHAGYGVEEDHYNAVGSALLFALGKGLGDAFTDETQTAWTNVYGLLSGEMLSAQRAAAT